VLADTCRDFAEKWICSKPAATEIGSNMKQFYKPALLLVATYALSALSIWSHG
jgi:hypothetical protein